MKLRIGTLLVHNDNGAMCELEQILSSQSLKVLSAHSCAEVTSLLAKPNPPHLIFTAPELPDGSWAHVLNSAASASAPTNVIVVVGFDDIKLYLEAMQCGAFDLISPPFSAFDITHVVRSATTDVLRRRGSYTESG
jgi:DNA-binding NtrC family response regulator